MPRQAQAERGAGTIPLVTMNNAQMVKCFNEWMRRFIEEPEAFAAEFQTVNQFMKDEANGVEPSYGETSAAYMLKLAQECPVE